MPISNSRCVGYREEWANSVTQLASAVRYGPFYPGCCTRLITAIDRISEVGAETLDAKMQTTDATGDFVDVLDHAGNAISFVQWADGSAIIKRVEVGPGTLSSDADDTITAGTNFKWYNCNIPSEFYWLLTGASGTSDTFSAFNEYLP